MAKQFEKWLDDHRKFPEVYVPFILRDILGYTEADTKRMSLEEYNYAVHYALITYVRRDLVFLLQGMKKKGRGDLDFFVEHQGIEDWIASQYEGMRKS